MSQDNSPPQSPPDPGNASRSKGVPELPPAIPDHQLLKRVGRGSYGEVWLAQNMMGVYRAVKIVYRASFQQRRPFERELSGIRKFEPISRSHEGFIDILHVGINEEAGYFYYVMEAGDDQTFGPDIRPETYSPKTLAKGISRHGPLPLRECLQLGLALSLALSELHKRALVHRDVKPSNIIFVNGIPKLADIGLVAEASEARSYVGTEGFIAPEGPGSAQADVYSLGKTLYEVSTGKDRHDFPELPTLLEDFPDMSGFIELNEVIVHACQNDLKSRYQSAWDMHTDLVVLAAGKSVKRLKILERRLARLKQGVGIAVLVLMALTVVFYLAYRDWKGAVELRQRQVGGSIAYGNRALESGDLLGALPFFVDAFNLDSAHRTEIPTHRLRVGSVLAQCPKLTHVWSEGSRANNAEFSPDGKLVLVAESHGSVKIYDLAKETMRSHSFGLSDWLWTAGFSPDGQYVVTANGNGSTYLLASSNLEEVCSLPHPARVDSARFSRDGLRLVTACKDGVVRVWDLRKRTVELTLPHSQKVRFADFSPDGLFIVTACEDSIARVWDTRNSQPLILPHPDWVNHAAFSPDGKKVVTACADHKARVWDARSGQRIMPNLSHGDGVMSAEFSPDGRWIVTAGLDGVARLWNADSLEPVLVNPIIRHGERLTHAGFSSDGRQIITSGTDGTIRIWDLAGSTVAPHPMRITVTEDGSRFLVVTNNTVELEDAISGQPVGPLIRSSARLEKAAMSRDGHFAALVLRSEQEGGCQIQVWDAIVGIALGPGISLSNTPTGLALSADGKCIVTGGGDLAQVWDAPTGIEHATLRFSESINSVFFNPAGTHFAVISGNKIEVHDTSSSHLCFPPLEFAQPVHMAEFSRDGSKLVGCCWDQLFTKCYAQVWGAADGQRIGPQLTHGDGVLFASFSPDGARVATASEDFTAILWDTITGRRLIPPVEHGEKVRSASFSPDGKWFVTSSFDKTARVWNAQTGDPLTPPLQHLFEVNDAVFLADGKTIVTRDGNDENRVWPLITDQRPIDDLLALSRLLAGRTEIRFGPLTEKGSDSLEVTWKKFRRKYPSTFEVSTEEIEQWHESQAEECEIKQQWFAEAFHLRFLLKLRPGDQIIAKKLEAVNKHVASDD